MSKKLIAGAGVAAAFAVALAPLATFAADATWDSDQHTDTWNVTVLPTCAFGAATAEPIDGITHNNGSSVAASDGTTNAATWTDGADNHLGMTPDAATGGTPNVSADSAAYSIYAGTSDATMGKTTLKVVCNQNAGYKIFVQADNLSDGETSPTTIDIKASPSATVTGYSITTADDGGLISEAADGSIANVTSTAKTAAVTYNRPSAATGDSWTFNYGIGIAPGFKADTYTGDVVYTLVQQLGS